MFSIYEAGNHLIICSDYIEPVLHSHSAAHIMISLENEIEVILENEKIHCRGILIPSQLETVEMGFFYEKTNFLYCIGEIPYSDLKAR